MNMHLAAAAAAMVKLAEQRDSGLADIATLLIKAERSDVDVSLSANDGPADDDEPPS